MKKFLVFSLLILSFSLCFSQSINGFLVPDSLNNKTFNYLEIALKKTEKLNSEKAEIYANCILLKGKKENITQQILAAYFHLYHISLNKNKSKLNYLDSIIITSKNINDFENLASAYLLKGNYYYNSGDYPKSLENYLSARNFSHNHRGIYKTAGFNVGLLKLELGNYTEAQKLFLNYKQYLEESNFSSRDDYVSCLYAIAYCYSKMNRLNLSDDYVKLGLEKSRIIDSQKNYSDLKLVSGINQYRRKNYNKAVETLTVVSEQLKYNSFDVQNLAISEFYIGMSFYKTNNNKFLNKFKRVDSIIIKTKNAAPELVDIYPILIQHYKNTKDKEKQLFYIENFLEVNRLLNRKSKILAKEISKKYDIPILLEDKEKLISDLNSKNSVLYWMIGFIVAVFLVLLFLYYNKSKTIKIYQKQAILLAKTSESNPGKIFNIGNEIHLKNEDITVKPFLSEEILTTLDLKFIQFEYNKEFLNRNLTLDTLAKDFKTNRDYLSRSVNELKGKSFSQYINELRINYLIEELKTDEKLQKLTIAGIAEEVGFNNSQSFTTAFKKITGTLPSYYLKALKNIEET